MRKMRFGLFALLTAFVVTSCEKFADGGLVSKAEKRIVNDWKLGTYLRNGVDETSLLFISNYVETYSDDGSYDRSYTDIEGNVVSESGNYSFDSEFITMDISGVSSIADFSEANSTVSSSSYTILMLTKDEYSYTYDNGGDTHEFRMVLQ